MSRRLSLGARESSFCTTGLALFCPTWFFFFNDPATTEIYTLSLHDALPISSAARLDGSDASPDLERVLKARHAGDRKSTRLNSSHPSISYAVFCLKKQNGVAAPITLAADSEVRVQEPLPP